MPKNEDYLPFAKSTDFIEYGFESEFVGRLPVVVGCEELEVEDLFQILKHSEGSIMRQYVQAFDAYGIELVLSDEGHAPPGREGFPRAHRGSGSGGRVRDGLSASSNTSFRIQA